MLSSFITILSLGVTLDRKSNFFKTDYFGTLCTELSNVSVSGIECIKFRSLIMDCHSDSVCR